MECALKYFLETLTNLQERLSNSIGIVPNVLLLCLGLRGIFEKGINIVSDSEGFWECLVAAANEHKVRICILLRPLDIKESDFAPMTLDLGCKACRRLDLTMRH